MTEPQTTKPVVHMARTLHEEGKATPLCVVHKTTAWTTKKKKVSCPNCAEAMKKLMAGKPTKAQTLTKGEIGACREALRLSDAAIETHIANALCDMALKSLKVRKCLTDTTQTDARAKQAAYDEGLTKGIRIAIDYALALGKTKRQELENHTIPFPEGCNQEVEAMRKMRHTLSPFSIETRERMLNLLQEKAGVKQ